jgi:hypothetical protein
MLHSTTFATRRLPLLAFVLLLPLIVLLPLSHGRIQAGGDTTPIVPEPDFTLPAPGEVEARLLDVSLSLTDTITTTLFLPLVRAPKVFGPPLPPPVAVSGTIPIDFEAVRAQLEADGKDLSFVKIGFHTGTGGNIDGLYDWMVELDAAGVPFTIKSADNAEPIYWAQQLAQASGVPHVLVYRRSSLDGDLWGWDVPDYNLPPELAAQLHWERHRNHFPPELDKELVWFETINEVDKYRSEWLGRFALATAQITLSEGYRWAAFGWSAGEPEPADWQTPSMLQFLELAAANPDRLAIALHEYSYVLDDIGHWYPYKVGRFQHLFQAVDQYSIDRPTVLITEWGWTYQYVPGVAPAMADIAWTSWLYAAYPQVLGAAIWYLGGNFDPVADLTQLLIAPMSEYSRSHYFEIDPGEGTVDPGLFQP